MANRLARRKAARREELAAREKPTAPAKRWSVRITYSERALAQLAVMGHSAARSALTGQVIPASMPLPEPVMSAVPIGSLILQQAAKVARAATAGLQLPVAR